MEYKNIITLIVFLSKFCDICICIEPSTLPNDFNSTYDVSQRDVNIQEKHKVALLLEKSKTTLEHIEYINHPLEIRVAMKDESDTSMMKGGTEAISYRVIADPSVVGKNFTLTFQVNEHILQITNIDQRNQIHFRVNSTVCYLEIFLKALNVGKTNVQIVGIHQIVPYLSHAINEESSDLSKTINKVLPFDESTLYDIRNSTITVSVYNSEGVKMLSEAFGWMYFVSWVIIFYPQIYGNWKTKSVVGVNFDFLAIVLVDLTLYTIYMVGLFFSRSIQYEYKVKHDTEVIPVKINDVVFGVLTICSSLILISQCKFYKTGGQQVSRTCKMILGLIFAFLAVVMIVTLSSNVFQWIDFLTYISFVKIFTVTKYIPQVYMNFKRRSTAGFSVGVVICDFNGGLFSIAQMIADSYNFDDWSSFSGNPTKFIVGLFTLVFDIVLIIQHYVCYRNAPRWEEIPSEEDNDENSNTLTSPNA